MSGFITYWSKDYMKQIEKHNDIGAFCVIYGSHHTRMPSISSLKIGDVVYPVTIKDGLLCIMARLPIEKIEPAFDYLIRETGSWHSALIPEGILIRSQGIHGEFNQFSGGSGYTDRITLPDNIHTVIEQEQLKSIPHKFHQEPITCCAELAASGKNGSEISPHIIPAEMISSLRFGKTKSSQKPLRTDKNGRLTTVSLSGFVRKMSEDTFEIFESFFR